MGRMTIKRGKLLSVAKFAELTLTTQKTLQFYDKIGVVTPYCRGKNNYRYYSHGQLAYFKMVRMLQAGGMQLNEIRDLAEHHTPHHTVEVLERQIRRSYATVENELRSRKLLSTLQASIISVLDVEEQAITIQFMPEMPIILGDLNDYSEGKNPFDALSAFYSSMSKKYPELDLNYPVWVKFSKEYIEKFGYDYPERFYFFNPEGEDKKQAGLYAVGYTRGKYGQISGLCKKILSYIKDNKLEISGDFYEEYPLCELCFNNQDQHLIRVMIGVG